MKQTESQSYRMVFVGKDCKDHLLITMAGSLSLDQGLLKASSRLALNTSSDRASTTAQSNLLTTLTAKIFFLASNLYLVPLQHKAIPHCPVTAQSWKK